MNCLESEFYYSDELEFQEGNECALVNYKPVGADEGKENSASQELTETFLKEQNHQQKNY